MAHLRDIPQPRCKWTLCPKPARVTLINNHSAPMGDYCKSHGEKALQKFLKETRAPTSSETPS